MSSDPFADEYLRQATLLSRLIFSSSTHTSPNFIDSSFPNLGLKYWGSASTILFPEVVLRFFVSRVQVIQNQCDIHTLQISFLIIIRDRYLWPAFCNWLNSHRILTCAQLNHLNHSIDATNYSEICLHLHAQILSYYSKCCEFHEFLASTVLTKPLVTGYEIEKLQPNLSCYMNTYELRAKINNLVEGTHYSRKSVVSSSVSVQWLRARSIDFWNVEHRQILKNFLLIPPLSHVTLVLPDLNLGIGDYIWEISKLATCSRFYGHYHITALPRSYHLLNFIIRRFKHTQSSFRVVRQEDIVADHYSRITSLLYVWSDLVRPRSCDHDVYAPPSKVSHDHSVTCNFASSLRIGIHSFSKNTSKPGHSFGLSWLKWLLDNTNHSFVLIHPILCQHDLDLFRELCISYPTRLSFPVKPVAADPDSLFDTITTLDLVIGVSSTSVCLSSVIGVPTVVLLPAIGIASKWSSLPEFVENNTTLMHVESSIEAIEAVKDYFTPPI